MRWRRRRWRRWHLAGLLQLEGDGEEELGEEGDEADGNHHHPGGPAGRQAAAAPQHRHQHGRLRRADGAEVGEGDGVVDVLEEPEEDVDGALEEGAAEHGERRLVVGWVQLE